MVLIFYYDLSDSINMRKFVITIISAIASWIGWWLGDHFGLFTAFILSMIGLGIGMYAGKRLIDF